MRASRFNRIILTNVSLTRLLTQDLQISGFNDLLETNQNSEDKSWKYESWTIAYTGGVTVLKPGKCVSRISQLVKGVPFPELQQNV